MSGYNGIYRIISNSKNVSLHSESYKHITSILSSTYACREINRLRCIQRDFQSAKNIFQWRNALCQAVICNIINNPPKIHLTFTLSNVRLHRLYRICFVWHNIQKTAHEKKKNFFFRSIKNVPRILAKSTEYIVFVFTLFTYLFVTCLQNSTKHSPQILSNVYKIMAVFLGGVGNIKWWFTSRNLVSWKKNK